MSERGSRLAALWRAVRALGHVLRGLWIIRSEFGQLTPDQCALMVREWSRQMLRILGVELVVQGEPPAHGPLLMVSNHISWLDILVLNAAHPSRFVSKADVKSWPLLGSDGAGSGATVNEATPSIARGAELTTRSSRPSPLRSPTEETAKPALSPAAMPVRAKPLVPLRLARSRLEPKPLVLPNST